MDRKVKLTAAIFMALLLGVGFGLYFGSVGVAPASESSGTGVASASASSSPGNAMAAYEFYCTGAVNWGPGGYVAAPSIGTHPGYQAHPDPDPSGFNFKITPSYWEGHNVSYSPTPPGWPPTPVLGKSSGVIEINVTNNLGYDIIVVDLIAEVTWSNQTLEYYFPHDGGYWGNFSCLWVDPLNPATCFWPGEDEELTGVVFQPPDMEEHYMAMGFDGAGVPHPYGPQVGKYCNTYGPCSLRQPFSVGKSDTEILPPEILAAGKTLTDHFAVGWGGNQTQGAKLYGTVKFTLVYLPRVMDVELVPREVVDLVGMDAIGKQWHELHPEKCNEYELISWTPGHVLSPGDQVYMTPVDCITKAQIGSVQPFWVDDVTVDLIVNHTTIPGWRLYLDYKCGKWTFDPKSPVSTKWNEINALPELELVFGRTWHLTGWTDNGDKVLGPCDNIVLTPMYPWGGTSGVFHVEAIKVTLELTHKTLPGNPRFYLESELDFYEFHPYQANPLNTVWREVYPTKLVCYNLTSWNDEPFLSPSDHIVLRLKNATGGFTPYIILNNNTCGGGYCPPGCTWAYEPRLVYVETKYHVDKVTVAMNMSSAEPLRPWRIVKFEGSLEEFKRHYWEFPDTPIGTQWHEVNPDYCQQWHVSAFIDYVNDGKFGPGDKIQMTDKESGDQEWFTVVSLSTDIIVSAPNMNCDIDVRVTHCQTTVTAGYKTWAIQISVTVKNTGTVNVNCTVTVYRWDSRLRWWGAPMGYRTIGSPQVVTNLAHQSQTTLTFNLNIVGLPGVTECTIKFLKVHVNCTADTGTGLKLSHSATWSGFKVRLLADMCEGTTPNKVDWEDLVDLGAAYGSDPTKPNWNPYANTCISATPCKVDWEDLVDLGAQYGKSTTCTGP